MDNKKKISLKSLILIFLIPIVIIGLVVVLNLTDFGQVVNLLYRTVKGEIDTEELIKENEILMGITDVEGPGIEISILDGTDLIHQEDLIILIDELKNAGSQAISVNDIRITNSSYLYCDGSVILIDGEKIGNPFKIKAIGDSKTLYGALSRNKGYISVLEKDGIKIGITENDTIKINKTNNEKLLKYGDNKNRIKKLSISNQLVGKSEVKGEGVRIVISETKYKLSAVSFLQLVNDLKSAGVKAISINGERITNMTDIMDISNTYVIVNSNAISNPYVIDVIGNREKIIEVLNYSNSQYKKIQDKGNEIELYEFNYNVVDKYTQKKDKDKMEIDYLK